MVSITRLVRAQSKLKFTTATLRRRWVDLIITRSWVRRHHILIKFSLLNTVLIWPVTFNLTTVRQVRSVYKHETESTERPEKEGTLLPSQGPQWQVCQSYKYVSRQNSQLGCEVYNARSKDPGGFGTLSSTGILGSKCMLM